MGRRWGKTTTAGAVALAAAAGGAKVAWVVPTYRNGRPLWRWAEAIAQPLKQAKAVEVNRAERTMEFLRSDGRRGFLGVYSADNSVGILGEWFNLVIVEEAARIAEETWTDVIQPTLADANGDAILISTPKGKNWFWREWQRGVAQMDGEYAAFTAPSSANPNPAIQRAAELAKDRVPDATYRQEWLAEFVSSAHNPFDPEWFRECRFSLSDDSPTWQAHRNSVAARWISCDTALEDTDAAAYSAFVVGELTADYRLFVREVRMDKLTFPNLLTALRALADEYGRDEHRVDGRHEKVLKGVIIESKVSGISAYQTLTEAGDFPVPVIPFRPQGSKEARAELAAVWCKPGCVWLPAPSPAVPWLFGFEQELFAFPDSPYKDRVDAFSQLILYASHYLKTGLEGRQAAAQALAVQREELA